MFRMGGGGFYNDNDKDNDVSNGWWRGYNDNDAEFFMFHECFPDRTSWKSNGNEFATVAPDDHNEELTIVINDDDNDTDNDNDINKEL